jgi:hypothetical protein
MLNVIDSDVAVVGREHELAVIRSFVAERRGPAALVLQGDAGIGKTTLWDAGVAAGSSAGYRVLRCRPAVAEAQLPFAAVADLLEDVLHDALPALPSPGRRALEVALLLDEADGPAPDVRAISGALLGVLRDVCAHTPVLVAIDDVQWLDEPSRTVLEFAIRRLRDEPVSLLVAQRGVSEEPPLGLGRALPLTTLQQLLLAPLSMGALHRVLEARLGTALSRPVLRRLYTTCEGNPFYALEIGRALQRRGSALRPDEPLPIRRRSSSWCTSASPPCPTASAVCSSSSRRCMTGGSAASASSRATKASAVRSTKRSRPGARGGGRAPGVHPPTARLGRVRRHGPRAPLDPPKWPPS